MQTLCAITNVLLVTAVLALVFGIPVVIIRVLNTRGHKKPKKN